MMNLSIRPLTAPLRVDDAGVVRVGASRISLDSLVASYRDGNTVEEMVQQYPSLALAEIHAALAYYLTNRPELDLYLERRQRNAAETRTRVLQVCDQRGIRDRLLARRAAKKLAT